MWHLCPIPLSSMIQSFIHQTTIQLSIGKYEISLVLSSTQRKHLLISQFNITIRLLKTCSKMWEMFRKCKNMFKNSIRWESASFLFEKSCEVTLAFKINIFKLTAEMVIRLYECQTYSNRTVLKTFIKNTLIQSQTSIKTKWLTSNLFYFPLIIVFIASVQGYGANHKKCSKEPYCLS